MNSLRFVSNSMKGTPSRFTSRFTKEESARVITFHRQLAGYQPTPLRALPHLAESLGLGGLYVKDESSRFGLNAFKGLGGTYAAFRLLCSRLSLNPDTLSPQELRENHAGQLKDLTLVTATDGNHGRGVAYAAQFFGTGATVFMPKGTVPARSEAIRALGAQVSVLDTDYDGCVKRAADLAKETGALLLQDTAWEGYETVPLWIMQGYLTLFEEAFSQIAPTHLFLQAGVGSVAGTGEASALSHLEHLPVLCLAEPHESACLYESILAGDGQMHTATGNGQTMMAGLNCGTPCSVAWDILRSLTDYAFSCPESTSETGIHRLGRPLPGDPRIVSGESGAVTLGLLLAIHERKDLWSMLGLGSNSTVLLVSTEGDTDPLHYRQVLGG